MPLLFCHRSISRRHLWRAAATASLMTLGIAAALFCAAQAEAALSRGQSIAAYDRATAIQKHLQAKPAAFRTRMDYERALHAYRTVYHGDPASPDAPRSIAAVADLLADAGRCFHQPKLFHDAVQQWEFLRRQYPTSSLRQQALFQEAQIQQYDLRDHAAAKKTYRLFLTQYPHNALAEQARAGLQNEPTAKGFIAHERALKQAADAPAEIPLARTHATLPEKNSVRPGSSTPVIWVDNDADSKPTSSTSTVSHATVSKAPSSAAALLKDVRYWDENGSTRLAIDLSDAVPYHTYSDQNGRKITILFFGAQSAEALLDHAIVVPHDELLRSVHVSMLTADQATLVLQMKRPVSLRSFVLSNPSRLILDLQPASPAELEQADAPPVQHDPTRAPEPGASQTRIVLPPAPIVKPLEKTRRTASAVPAPADAGEETPAVRPSMARVLGLRVRRIVIDAGHGGHDSGTIGPRGIEEKDIALDVALRLGRLLQQRLGAEVIYTRRTDKFVPLEERTAIANAAQADLFLSIHANSSSDPDVRGVETYFMNFTTSADAMAVASRENADSNRSVYELSDLVRKIALSAKIDESREFAADVQQQLYSGLLSGNAGMKNRGVKQAPFVVLIGAQMPSILAEISFLTNREDAAELSRPRYRERLAEALYGGVAEYIDGMSGVRIAKTIPAEALAASAE
jgi:N-acetylmuramoyl-L-alanine amidase